MQRTVSTAGELSVHGRRPKCSLCSCQAAPPVPPDSVQPGRRRPNTLCTALCPGVRLLPVASWTSRSRVDMCGKPRRTTGPPAVDVDLLPQLQSLLYHHVALALHPCEALRVQLLALGSLLSLSLAGRAPIWRWSSWQRTKLQAREREAQRRGSPHWSGAPTAALSERTPEPARLLRQARPARPPASKA